MKKPEFSVSPLFYDALSKEFSPACDSRIHTLGRLSSAAVLKGELERVGWEGHPNTYARYTYKPSWAEQVVCTVEGIYVNESHIVMRGLTLQDNPELHGHFGPRLRIERNDGKPFSMLSLGESSSSRMVYPTYEEAVTVELNGTSWLRELALGEKLAEAQTIVANAASEFFSED